MKITKWLARERTFLNYLRDGYIDWSVVPQHEINSLIHWTLHGSDAEFRIRDIQVLGTSPIEYIQYLADKEISIAEDSLREYGRQYELGEIAQAKLESNYETI